MLPEELKGVLFDVLASWQVLGATGVLILYLCFVSYVARSYRRPRFASKSRPKKARKAAVTMAKSTPEEAPDSDDSNEALGLKEDD